MHNPATGPADAEALRVVFDAAPEGIVISDANGVIRGFNPAASAIFGWPRESALGRNIRELMPPDVRPPGDEAFRNFMASQVGVGLRVVGLRADGSHVPIKLSVSAAEMGGERRFIAIISDTTDLARAEHALATSEAERDALRTRAERLVTAQYLVARALAEAADLKAATPRILSAMGELLEWDWAALWTRLPPDPADRLCCLDVWHTDGVRFDTFDAAARRMAFAPGEGIPGRVWQTGRAMWVADVLADPGFRGKHAARADGLHAAFALPIVQRGDVSGVLEFLSRDVRQPDESMLTTLEALSTQIGDFIERKTAEAEVVRARDIAEAAAQARAALVATVSHEIRTPLNGVVGMLSVLLRSDLSPAQREQVHIAERSAMALLDITNDVLDFSKADAGQLVIEQVTFDLDGMVDTLASELGPQAASKQLAFDVERPDGALGVVVGDPVRIRQVLHNLLGNALKFTERGRIVLRVSRSATDERERALYRFAVEDTGCGIPEASQARIFEPFAQADASTTRRFGGTGLGLTICGRLAALMGGSVRLERSTSSGSTFVFEVPLAVGSRADLVPAIAPRAARQFDAHVLIVDDHAVNQHVATEMVRAHGCTVDVVSNGAEAIDAVARRAYDLVLMDCRMPVMDGFEATRTIRQTHTPDALPIIAMTANAMPEDQVHCLRAGMNGVLTKPMVPRALEDTLARFTTPVVDRGRASQARELMATEPGAWSSVVAMLVRQARDADAALPALVAAGDLDAVRNHGHGLKGSAAMIGAARLSRLGAEIEDAAKAGDRDRCAQLLPRLAGEIDAAAAALGE